MNDTRHVTTATPASGITVLLVEDDSLLRESLESLLTLAGFIVTAVPDALSCYRALATRPHVTVAIIDLGLPDAAGETLIDFLRHNTDTALIALTARNTLDTRVACYRAGADLFLGKPVDGRELAAAIHSLATRHPPAPSAQTETAAVWVLNARARTLTSPGGQRIGLTQKAAQLLTVLLAEPGQTVRRATLLDSLYGREDESAHRALDQLVRRTRQAIAEASGDTTPLLTEHGVGYAFIEAARRSD